jgi:hypothetical protein
LMDRLGALPSAGRFGLLVAIRNRLGHSYPFDRSAGRELERRLRDSARSTRRPRSDQPLSRARSPDS